MQAADQLPPQQAERKFDLRTHVRDKKGKVTVNTYRLHIINGVKCFERPVGSKNLFFENDDPAGRLIEEFDPKNPKKRVKYDFDHNAEHVAYVPPATRAELERQENENLRKKNAALEAELKAIKAANEAKDEAKKPAAPEAPKGLGNIAQPQAAPKPMQVAPEQAPAPEQKG